VAEGLTGSRRALFFFAIAHTSQQLVLCAGDCDANVQVGLLSRCAEVCSARNSIVKNGRSKKAKKDKEEEEVWLLFLL
jgi:hypothetical protein